MKRFYLKGARSLVNNRRLYPVYAIIALALALCIALSIALVSRSRYVSALEQSRENLAMTVRSNIHTMARTYDQIRQPGANTSALITSMRDSLMIAVALNDALVDSYGLTHTVLSEEMFETLNGNLNQMQDALAMGRTIDEACAVMDLSIAQVNEAISIRFRGDDGLIPISAT